MEQAGLFRCRICGEVYFGSHPSHCPFCGAYQGYLVKVSEWADENNGVKPNEREKEFLAKTMELEYTNTRFYRAAAAESSNLEIKGFFKYLAKIENEHYNVAAVLLGVEKDSTIYEPSESLESDIHNLEHSKQKEEEATKLYGSFIPECESPRLKTFFGALSEIESDHIGLDVEEIAKIEE